MAVILRRTMTTTGIAILPRSCTHLFSRTATPFKGILHDNTTRPRCYSDDRLSLQRRPDQGLYTDTMRKVMEVDKKWRMGRFASAYRVPQQILKDSYNSNCPLALYRRRVEEGKLSHDHYQEMAAMELEVLLGKLNQYEKEMEEYRINISNWEKSREGERQRLLFSEAELKQQDSQNENGLFRKSFTRKRNQHAEPGVGRMVSFLNREKMLDSLVGKRPVAPAAPKGLYIYGNVGSGKTMLMDMFYDSTEGIVEHRRRFHFHEAMLEIHELMHDVWKNQVEEKSSHKIFDWISKLPFETKVKEWLLGEERYNQEAQLKHILPAVADKFLVGKNLHQRGASILCFDEIQTIDVFAVVALSGIVSRLLATGTVLVATSNRAPKDLNQDGMQQDIFLQFVSKLEENCQNILVGSNIDYRRLLPRKSFDQNRYFWPLNSDSREKFDALWTKITNQYGGEIASQVIPVMFGRELKVSESCNGVARFTFEYLCGRPVGAADYIAIAKNYHSVFISGIPVMSMRIRDKARRFITLIDELYNHHCQLYCTSDTSIDELFQGSDEGTLFDLESFQFETEMEDTKLRRDVLTLGNAGLGASTSGIISLLSSQEEMFAFRRAVSRLIEMQTPLYLEGVQLSHPYFEGRNQHKYHASSLLQPSL